jgi:hypothetical protein
VRRGQTHQVTKEHHPPRRTRRPKVTRHEAPDARLLRRAGERDLLVEGVGDDGGDDDVGAAEGADEGLLGAGEVGGDDVDAEGPELVALLAGDGGGPGQGGDFLLRGC